MESLKGRMQARDDAAATPPPSPRSAQKISVAAVVEGLGGVDGLIAILREYWRSDQFVMVYKREWLERRNVPKDIVDLLMDLEEAICRGFLDDCRAIGMAVCRVQLLIGENITLPLARDRSGCGSSYARRRKMTGRELWMRWALIIILSNSKTYSPGSTPPFDRYSAASRSYRTLSSSDRRSISFLSLSEASAHMPVRILFSCASDAPGCARRSSLT